jgi:hypothetical protein
MDIFGPALFALVHYPGFPRPGGFVVFVDEFSVFSG